jgi:adenosylcobinamide-phosphate synthase
MTLFVIILVLIIEQMHALPVVRMVQQPVAALCRALEQRFNDGHYAHGAIAWGLGVGLPALLIFGLYIYLWAYQTALAFLLSLGMLYLTMGFRQFSHYFTEIQEALRADDIDLARRTLAEWRGQSGDRLSSSDVARLSIEEALLASHRHVFAPLFWFAVMGPAGAFLYRLADLFKRSWGERDDVDFGEFGVFARQAFMVIDWVPVRLTAFAFAIVGDFEDAIYCWRTQASRWADSASGILLSSGAGALGVRLGLPVPDPVQMDGVGDDRPELGLGEEADPDLMQSTIGLVWRTLVLVLLLLGLVWVSGWMGS